MSTLKVSTISPLGTDATKTITLGDSAGTLAIASGAKTSGFGKIGQVVSTTKTDEFSTSSTSVTDITGLSVSITPSSTSSKILILVDGNVSDNNTTYAGAMKLFRDSTEICKGTNGSANNIGFDNVRRNSGSDESKKFSINFLDSPSTTSSTTYKISIKLNQSNTFYINRIGSGNENSLVSTITAMEVLD